MANNFRGEVTLDNGMVMVFNFNAMIEFEDITGKDLTKGFDFANMTLRDTRAFYYVCLKVKQPEITVEEAGDIFGEYPDALLKVILAASPEAAKAVEGASTSKKKQVRTK